MTGTHQNRGRAGTSGLPPLYEMTSDIVMYLDELQRVMNDTKISGEERDVRVNELTAEIESCSGDVETKLTAIRNRICAMEGEMNTIDSEVERLKNRKRVKANSIEGMKEYAFEQLKRMDGARLDTDLFSMSISKNTPKLVIEDEALIPSINKCPDIWKRQAPVLDKTKLKDMVKGGTPVPGCSIEQGERLSIK